MKPTVCLCKCSFWLLARVRNLKSASRSTRFCCHATSAEGFPPFAVAYPPGAVRPRCLCGAPRSPPQHPQLFPLPQLAPALPEAALGIAINGRAPASRTADVLAMKPKKSRGLLSALPLDPSRFHEAQLSPDASARRRQDQSISGPGVVGRPAGCHPKPEDAPAREPAATKSPNPPRCRSSVGGPQLLPRRASSSVESAVFAEGSCSQVKFSCSASPGFGVPSQGGVCSARGRPGSPRARVLLAPGG